MQTSAELTLAKWGNSQGFRIPKEICESIGLEIGTHCRLYADQEKSEIIIVPDKPEGKYRRNRKVTLEELFEGWDGGRAGEEWGGPDVGAEVVR